MRTVTRWPNCCSTLHVETAKFLMFRCCKHSLPGSFSERHTGTGVIFWPLEKRKDQIVSESECRNDSMYRWRRFFVFPDYSMKFFSHFLIMTIFISKYYREFTYTFIRRVSFQLRQSSFLVFLNTSCTILQSK